MRAQGDAKNWNKLIRLFGANFDILNMASSDSDFSDVEANAEVDDGEAMVNEGLPSRSERDLIEYYFNRGPIAYVQANNADVRKTSSFRYERTSIETD